MFSAALTTGAAWLLSARALRDWGRTQVLPLDPVDAIVVLGCRVSADGRPSAALERRVQVAVRLFHRGYGHRLILSGGAHPGLPAEAEVADRIADRLGVPASARVVERTSTNTRENAEQCAKLLRGPVIVVTDDYHLFRAMAHFRAQLSVPVYGAPAPSDGWRGALREVPAAFLATVRHRLRA